MNIGDVYMRRDTEPYEDMHGTVIKIENGQVFFFFENKLSKFSVERVWSISSFNRDWVLATELVRALL